MIEIADFVSGTPLRMLEGARRFTEAANTSGVGFSVSDHWPTATSDIEIVYQAEPYDNHGPTSSVRLATRGEAGHLTTYLAGAVRLLTLLADDPHWLERMRSLSIEDRDPWADFDLSGSEILKPAVKPWMPGDYIAPCETGFAVFTVDTHGEVLMQADAETLALAVFYFAAMQAYSAARTGEKFARIAKAAR